MAEETVNDFILSDEEGDGLHISNCPTTAPHQMAPRLWADRWAPCYRQFRVYFAGEPRGVIFQESPASRDWKAEKPDGTTEHGLPTQAAAVNWLIPERRSVTTKAHVSRQRSPKEGNKMSGYQIFEPAVFEAGTRLTINTKDGREVTGVVQADGTFIDREGKTFRSATNWHKKETGRYGRSWTVEAPTPLVASAEEEAPAATEEAPAKPKRSRKKAATTDAVEEAA